MTLDPITGEGLQYPIARPHPRTLKRFRPFIGMGELCLNACSKQRKWTEL